MSLINGIAALGSGLKAAGDDITKEEDQKERFTSLLNSAPQTPAAQPVATSYGDPSLPGPRMPAGANPYGQGPNAQALWAAELAIKGPESGGKADAQNSISSAGGLFQVIDSTFKSALEKMGITPPQSQAELSAMKYDPGLNTSVMRVINKEAAEALNKAGLPVNVQTLQAAHRLGVGGAVSALRAAMENPDAPLVNNGLAESATQGNGDISGLTVGQFLKSPYPRSGT